MVEGVELDKKKREFYDASVEIIRLIGINQIEEAKKLYNLYTNLYYEILPVLNEQEVSQYYQNLSQIYNRLKPYFAQKADVSEIKRHYKTEIDELYELIQEKGKITLKAVQSKFKIDRKKADEWATILEENGLIKINYSFFIGPILKKLS
ncbi:hypothetical protein ISS04_01875 [Candidatus Woesearchaeota archaeon]|nr:hypothetical protein [Candidatus Woesearchaeota archaeon]